MAQPCEVRDSAGYAQIGDYGFLSDCRSAALVAKDGSVDWLCWPRFDSPAIFAAILDPERGGRFKITPTEPFEVERSYQPNTNVLHTTMITRGGRVKITDWLHTGARHALCRLVMGLEGDVEMQIDCDPRPEYGSVEGPVRWQERLGYLVHDIDEEQKLVLDGLDQPRSTVMVSPGVVIPITLGLGRPGPSDPLSSLKRTVTFWEQWTDGLRLPKVAEEQVTRSALVLKGLQYQPTGAIIAAPTTSLPEQVGGSSNWDYRYSWLRDAAFTIYALGALGKEDEAESWFDWLKALTLQSGQDHLQILYGIMGHADAPESELGHLSGYRNSRPVRIGNGAAGQTQLDTYGELLDAMWLQQLRTGRLFGRHRARLAVSLAERAMSEWRNTDEGIWETRGEQRHFTYSKVMCWVALDRAIRIARSNPKLLSDAPVAGWKAERDLIREEVLRRSYNEHVGAFTQSYDSDVLDASNLLLAQVGFISASDPRFVSTVRATQRGLDCGNGMIYRYPAERPDDGHAQDDGTFVIASFWLCLGLLQIGCAEEAQDLFDQVCSHANDLGLLAEEVSPAGEQLGNFPQAFSHIALIACAFALNRAIEGRRTALRAPSASGVPVNA